MSIDIESKALRSISADELHSRLRERIETSILDVRSNSAFVREHILRSTPLPFGLLEARIDRAVPRKSTFVVVVDDGEQLAVRSAERLRGLGYLNVVVLSGGLAAWREAGLQTISGQHAISKALGEYVERNYDTPRLTPQELQRRRADGEEIIVIDTRPSEEFGYVAIPDSVAAPGVEILYRFDEVVPSPFTTVVITCAGRTRGIIGAQALLNAGIPNPVYSLENGTSGWEFAGLEPLRGAARYAPAPDKANLRIARDRAAEIERRSGVVRISGTDLAQFRAEADTRSLYLFDIRTTDEYRAGHIPGALSVPGGQLVQTTDLFVGTQYARIVVVDGEDGVRGALTASWLLQMDVGEVFLYAAEPAAAVELGDAAVPLPKLDHARYVDAADIAGQVEAGRLTVIDFASVLSGQSDRRVVPESWYATRASLPARTGDLPGLGDILFLSEDGVEAAFAANDIERDDRRNLLVFRGGTRAWEQAGLPLVDEAHEHSLAPEGSPNPRRTIAERKASFDDYVAWGDVIVDQIRADGTLVFKDLV